MERWISVSVGVKEKIDKFEEEFKEEIEEERKIWEEKEEKKW